jgi:hypothetical protein
MALTIKRPTQSHCQRRCYGPVLESPIGDRETPRTLGGWDRGASRCRLVASVGEGHWVVSSGNVTDEMWVDYIKNQTPPEPDDNFKVTWRHVRRRRTNPALSRNLKPPPLGGGVFTLTHGRKILTPVPGCGHGRT